jgi:hypothetical protein
MQPHDDYEDLLSNQAKGRYIDPDGLYAGGGLRNLGPEPKMAWWERIWFLFDKKAETAFYLRLAEYLRSLDKGS